jgi:hypothetical protein
MRRNPEKPGAPAPPSDAIAHDQLRDARDGIERSGGSDRGQRLPHERDESPDARADGEHEPIPDRHVVQQAADDLERGLEDTEARGIPSNPPAASDNRAPAAEHASDERHRR